MLEEMPLWTAEQCAQLVEVQVATWNTYVAHGLAPAPAVRIRGGRLWSSKEVVEWFHARPRFRPKVERWKRL